MILLYIWIPFDSQWVEIFSKENEAYISQPIFDYKTLQEVIKELKNENKYNIEELKKEIKAKIHKIKKQFGR